MDYLRFDYLASRPTGYQRLMVVENAINTNMGQYFKRSRLLHYAHASGCIDLKQSVEISAVQLLSDGDAYERRSGAIKRRESWQVL